MEAELIKLLEATNKELVAIGNAIAELVAQGRGHVNTAQLGADINQLTTAVNELNKTIKSTK